eukprot:673370-Hanusia_phi.AAC.5
MPPALTGALLAGARFPELRVAGPATAAGAGARVQRPSCRVGTKLLVHKELAPARLLQSRPLLQQGVEARRRAGVLVRGGRGVRRLRVEEGGRKTLGIRVRTKGLSLRGGERGWREQEHNCNCRYDVQESIANLSKRRRIFVQSRTDSNDVATLQGGKVGDDDERREEGGERRRGRDTEEGKGGEGEGGDE